MKPSHPTLVVCFVLAAAACTPKPDPAPSPSASANPAATTTSGAVAPTPVVPTRTPTAAPNEEQQSADTWFVVSEGGIELGVIELRAGKAPKLNVENETDASKRLREKLAAIGGPKGIGLDMHLPPPSGKGRGPYGTVIVKYGDPLYRNALQQELEPQYHVREVLSLIDAPPPPNVKTLQVARSGEKVGSVDFSKSPPKVTVHSDRADSDSLKGDMERIAELGTLKFRYHRPAANGVDTLVTAEAKPGDAHYAQTAILYLMVERYYRARYAYQLSFDE